MNYNNEKAQREHANFVGKLIKQKLAEGGINYDELTEHEKRSALAKGCEWYARTAIASYEKAKSEGHPLLQA